MRTALLTGCSRSTPTAYAAPLAPAPSRAGAFCLERLRMRKLRPGFGAQNGMRFPVEASNGKCVPEYGSSLGCIFRLKPQAETASRNSVSERVVLSGSPLNRKLCPGIMPQDGTRFPLAWPLGKRGPNRGVRFGDAWPSSSYSSISLSHVGSAVCRMPAVCSFLASIPAERTSFMVKRSRGWP